MLFERTVLRDAKKRHVTLLLHSTHLYRNLPQILADGRIHTARELMARYGPERAAYYLHDPRRYEQFAVGLDYINAAISVPNAQLLYHRSKAEWGAEWVHLALDLELLNRENTLFSPVSAAAERGKFIAPGRAGFAAMFAEQVAEYERRNLPAHEPTHPQAEVLIKGPLPLDVVDTVLVPSPAVASEVRRLISRHPLTLSVNVAPHLFAWPARLMSSE
jgi:hypothetical protein